MADYKAMYYRLFNRVTDAIRVLQEAQAEAEETFIRYQGGGPVIPLRREESAEKDNSDGAKENSALR